MAVFLLGACLWGEQAEKFLDRHHGQRGLTLGCLFFMPEIGFFWSFRLLFHIFTYGHKKLVLDEGIKKALAHISLWGRALEKSLAARGATPVSLAI